jgi:hypothetical protein
MTRKEEILILLENIDKKTIRPIREKNIDKITELEKEAEVLREELRGLDD